MGKYDPKLQEMAEKMISKDGFAVVGAFLKSVFETLKMVNKQHGKKIHFVMYVWETQKDDDGRAIAGVQMASTLPPHEALDFTDGILNSMRASDDETPRSDPYLTQL